jgi:hypothetical protein
METQMKKISLDILIKYIKDNINIINDSDIIIEKEKQPNITKTLKPVIKKEKSFLENFDEALSGTTLNFPNISNLFSNNLLKDFLIYKVDEEYSFYKSLLCILDQNFSSFDLDKQNLIVKNFIQYLKSDIMMLGFAQYEYSKIKFNKKSMYNDLDNNIMSKEIMRYCADVFHINIFYIDYKDGTINYTGGNFIPFKKSVLLLKINDIFSILQINNSKIFRFNNNEFFDSILKNTDKINLLTCEKFNICTEDLNKYIKKDKNDKNNKNYKIKNTETDTYIDFDKIMEKTDNKQKDNNSLEFNDNLNGYDIDNESNDESNDNIDKKKSIIKSDIKVEKVKVEKVKVEKVKVEKKIENKIEHIDTRVNENMSLSELQKLAKDYGISITIIIDGKKKIKNKKDLCTEILEHL